MKPVWRNSQKLSWLYRVIIFSTWWFFKVFYHHRTYGLEHFYQENAIIAANHASFYDPPILAISWPQEVHFLAREGLFKNPFFGGLIRGLNTHPIKGGAGDIAVFKTVCGLLEEGKKIILFPEGKRCFDNALGALKPGIAVLVSRSKSAVIPAYIHGSFKIWNRKRLLPKLWGKTACVFGTPICWSDFAHLDKKIGQRALIEKVESSIRSLRKWYEEGARGTPP